MAKRSFRKRLRENIQNLTELKTYAMKFKTENYIGYEQKGERCVNRTLLPRVIFEKSASEKMLPTVK